MPSSGGVRSRPSSSTSWRGPKTSPRRVRPPGSSPSSSVSAWSATASRSPTCGRAMRRGRTGPACRAASRHTCLHRTARGAPCSASPDARTGRSTCSSSDSGFDIRPPGRGSRASTSAPTGVCTIGEAGPLGTPGQASVVQLLSAAEVEVPYGPRSRPPPKWMRWSGSSAHHTELPHAKSVG